MGMSIEFIVEKFLQSYSKPFTRSEFSAMMKGLRLVSSDKEANALLDSFDCIYKISDDYYVTRSGAFLDYYFSFQPTKEEIENGVFLIGDRCIPFIDSEYEISFLNFCFDGQKLNKKAVEFDSDFVLNFYSLYGDEYASQVIASDVVNRDVELSKSGYELPSKVKVTCIDIEPFIRDGRFSLGDRIVCRVMDFLSGTISIEFLKQNSDKSVFDIQDSERKDWYSKLENALVNSFEKNGPLSSICAQLTSVFIENKDALSVKNSGSVQELLEFSNKICYQSFGVETRLWKTGEEIPAIGDWNEQVSAAEADDSVFLDFSEEDLVPQVIIDAFVKNSLFKKDFDSDSLIEKIYPYYKYFSSELKKSTLLNLKRRHDILKKSYNYFADYNAACVRSDVLELFSRVNELMSRISIECTDIKNLPSQELVVLSQIYQHLVKFLEFFQFDDVDKSLGDIKVSVDNMTFTFDVISEDLIRALVIEGRKGFKIGEN